MKPVVLAIKKSFGKYNRGSSTRIQPNEHRSLLRLGGEEKLGKNRWKIERTRVIVKISRRQTSASGLVALFRCGHNFNNKSIAMFGKCLVLDVKLRAVVVQQIVVYFRWNAHMKLGVFTFGECQSWA